MNTVWTHFFSQFLLEKCYESPWKVFVLIFCLFHGQAAIEHGFKMNNDFSVINQSKESLIALRIVKDHLNAKYVTAANIPITRNMISNVKATRARYFEEIEQKKEEENQCKINLKRKIVSDFFFFLIRIHSMQGRRATTRQRVTRKRNTKRSLMFKRKKHASKKVVMIL